jgi:phage host-nuclease inhibitor protein Gam
MTTRLADTRRVSTMEDARRLMAEIRRLKCDNESIIARYEKRIAALGREASEKTDSNDKALADLERQLATFIISNKPLFQKPRKVKTDDGTFGLHLATGLKITDKDALLQAILDRGYDDCVRVKHSLVKSRIRERIEDLAESFPGCHIEHGDIAICEVHKALLEEANARATAHTA